MSLEVRLLGPFEILVDGERVDVRGTKRQALVAYLALRAGRVVAADALVEALWGSDLPSAPRNAVQHHVARLRPALGAKAIRLDRDGYVLEGALVDVSQFESLLETGRSALRAGDAWSAADTIAAALALWRGPALLGFTDLTWASTEAGRLEALRLDALEERFDAALTLGQHAEITPAIRATIEESPFRERLWGQLMLALYRSGRQADALDTYQDARRVLSDDLGLEPGPELQRLQQAILAHDPAIAAVPAAPRRRGNLPAPVTSFVGRQDELADVVRLARENRLVTLTGPPGVGKSRLALEAMHALESDVRDGIWLVDLDRAGAPDDVVRVVAQTLDEPGSRSGGDPLARLLAWMRDSDAVVVLDSCERFPAEVRELVAAMLAASPRARVVATSRQALDVSGEARLRLFPLSMPADVADADAVAGSEAVQLFVERARAARPGFALDADEAVHVAEICRRLDGLPLAIELAAARTGVFGVAEILAVLERRFALLLTPGADASGATSALEALVAWSYDLLHGDEKTLLHQLAVHRGGASLAALVAAGAEHGLEEATVIQLLSALVDKSIVSVSFESGEARYGLLDTVRDYALERLDELGGLDSSRRAHAEFFAVLADRSREELRQRSWRACVGRLELEHDNLWAALAYARDAPDPGIAARLGALGWYFALAQRVSDGRRFVELALDVASSDAPGERDLELLTYTAYLATEERDVQAGVAWGERALALTTPETAPEALALAESSLALALAESGDEARALALTDDACARLEPDGDAWTRAACELLRALVAARTGAVDTVASTAAAVTRHAESIGFDAFLVPAVLLEAWVGDQRRSAESAESAYRRAFELSLAAGFGDHAAFALTGLAESVLARGDLAHAEELSRRAIVAADAARAAWTGAQARVALGRVLAAAGHPRRAEELYRSVVDWSESDRSHEARETLFIALGGSPAAAALVGLAELADGRGESALADDLRGRAASRAQLDGAPGARVSDAVPAT